MSVCVVSITTHTNNGEWTLIDIIKASQHNKKNNFIAIIYTQHYTEESVIIAEKEVAKI